MKKIIPFALLATSVVCHAQQQNISKILHFDSNKSSISASDKKWLDSIATVLRNAATYTIDVKAYCDADGSDEANISLANMRATVVKNTLLAEKLTESAITANAFGENSPVADNATAEGKARNRRAVLTIVYEKKKAIENVTKIAPVEEKTENNAPAKSLSEAAAADLKVGEKLIVKNLNFEGGNDVLLKGSEPALQELLKLMKDHPTLHIEVGGHVCCGPDMELSIQRAKRVYNYLADNGVRPERMTYKGYSFDKPIASERDEEGKTLNRRVEITILKL